MSNNIEGRLAELEERAALQHLRIQHLEDHIALYQSLAAYGPAVDSKNFREGTELWEEDGVYDLGDGFPEIDEGRGIQYLNGREEIEAMLDNVASRPFFDAGCAHVMSTPLIKISGDTAVGIGYHMTYVDEDGQARLARLNSSRLDWRRQESGQWKLVKRTHRLIDGREDGQALLADALHEITDK